MIFKYEYFNLINLYFSSSDLKENDPLKPEIYIGVVVAVSLFINLLAVCFSQKRLVIFRLLKKHISKLLLKSSKHFYIIKKKYRKNICYGWTKKPLINKGCKHVTIISQPNLKSLIIFILQLFRSVIRANKLVDFFHTLIFVIKCICSYDVQWFVIVTSSEYFRVTFTKN